VPNIIVIGASAGGVQALKDIVRHLPVNLQAAIFVVVHISPLGPSVLPEILNTAGNLHAAAAVDGEAIEPSRIYVAPPDRHLLIEPGFVRLTRGARENRFRPAIDPLFRTAARAYGERVAGVILTGLLGDGTTGLEIIKSEGGTTIVQDPKEAAFDAMPLSALRAVEIDHVLPAAQIGEKIVGLVQEPWTGLVPARAKALEKVPVTEDERMPEDERVVGKPSMFTCPDCSGTLWELGQAGVLRFRCRVGHAYSEDGMRAGYSESVESALWTAVRALEESAALERKLAQQAAERGANQIQRRFNDVAEGREEQAEIIKNILLPKDNKPHSEV
jgi:two-component system chemotaxis response regulator CheB